MSTLIRRSAVVLALGAFAFAAPALANRGDKAAKFKMMDTNGDEKISAEEHAAGARTKFTEMDKNADGKVNESEMTAFHAAKLEAKGGRAGKEGRAGKSKISSSQKISEIDVDGDGVLTSTEHVDGARQRFLEMDKDSDGYLTRSEFEAGNKRLTPKS